jgi:hypothetical protein
MWINPNFFRQTKTYGRYLDKPQKIRWIPSNTETVDSFHCFLLLGETLEVEMEAKFKTLITVFLCVSLSSLLFCAHAVGRQTIDYSCFLTSEEKAIELTEGRAIRKEIESFKSKLIIKTQEIDVEFETTGNKYGEYGAKYTYKGYIESLRYHLVHFSKYLGEVSGYILVSDKSGKQYVFHGDLHFSKSGQRIFVASSDGSGDNTDELTIWQFTSTEVSKVFSYKPEVYSVYKFLGWKGENMVWFENFRKSDKAFCPNSYHMTVNEQVEFGINGWARSIDSSKEIVCH